MYTRGFPRLRAAIVIAGSVIVAPRPAAAQSATTDALQQQALAAQSGDDQPPPPPHDMAHMGHDQSIAMRRRAKDPARRGCRTRRRCTPCMVRLARGC